MSISDGMNPYIFRRKMEKTLSLKEKMEGRNVYFPPESAYFFCNSYDQSTFPYFVPWHVNNYVSGQKKGINKRK